MVELNDLGDVMDWDEYSIDDVAFDDGGRFAGDDLFNAVEAAVGVSADGEEWGIIG